MMISPHSEALYHALWDHALIGVALVREDGFFLSANPTFCKLTEYSEAELKTKKYLDITHPDDAAFDQIMSEELLLGKIRSYDMPKRYLTKFGRVVTMMLRVTSIREPEYDQHGKFICFLSQIGPLNEHQINVAGLEKQKITVRRKLFWRQVTQYWPLIVFGIGIIASAVVQILERI